MARADGEFPPLPRAACLDSLGGPSPGSDGGRGAKAMRVGAAASLPVAGSHAAPDRARVPPLLAAAPVGSLPSAPPVAACSSWSVARRAAHGPEVAPEQWLRALPGPVCGGAAAVAAASLGASAMLATAASRAEAACLSSPMPGSPATAAAAAADAAASERASPWPEPSSVRVASATAAATLSSIPAMLSPWQSPFRNSGDSRDASLCSPPSPRAAVAASAGLRCVATSRPACPGAAFRPASAWESSCQPGSCSASSSPHAPGGPDPAIAAGCCQTSAALGGFLACRLPIGEPPAPNRPQPARARARARP